jgi:hypothetical protein
MMDTHLTCGKRMSHSERRGGCRPCTLTPLRLTKAGTCVVLVVLVAQVVGTSLAPGLRGLVTVRHHQRGLVALHANAVLCCVLSPMGFRSTKDPGQELFSFKIGLGQVWDPGCSLRWPRPCTSA